MKVKIFDCEHELDLEEEVNKFISDKQVIDIKYQVATLYAKETQIYCYTCMILYK